MSASLNKKIFQFIRIHEELSFKIFESLRNIKNTLKKNSQRSVLEAATWVFYF